MNENQNRLAALRNAPHSFVNFVNLAAKYVSFNFKAQMEYRAAFVSQVLAMLLNDCAWLAFWMFFFNRFPVLGDWNQKDLITMWALAAAGFGIAHGTAGNAGFIATVIVKGQLDTWLLYPRAVLPHLLFGKMHVTSWGDVVFGVLAYVLLVQPSLPSFALFLFLVVTVAVLFIGFDIFVGSLGFFIGNAEGLSEQIRFALITFSTYPPSVFNRTTKLILYTIIPAGFISFMPVNALKHHSLELAFIVFGVSLISLWIGVSTFYYGLRRYESGNLVEMRG